jgi:hypothetical protein
MKIAALVMTLATTPAIHGEAPPVDQPQARSVLHLGRPHVEVRYAGSTWLYDVAGGGFSRLLDPDGRDWIGFRPEPLAEFPASAAAGFRGLGNLVHGGPDDGVGHPGFDRCETVWEAPRTLRTRSKSGKWEWTWTFRESGALLEMIKADPERAWWFLYEGNPHGEFAPERHEWGTSESASRTERPMIAAQLREPLVSVWFGDAESRFRLVLRHDTDKPHIANLWWMGACSAGQWRGSADGMLVFGFGRGPAREGPLLRGAHRFVVRLQPRS